MVTRLPKTSGVLREGGVENLEGGLLWCLPSAQRSVARWYCFQYSVRLWVCLFVNTITLEPFEISWWNFSGSKIWSKAWMSSKAAAFRFTAARRSGFYLEWWCTFCCDVATLTARSLAIQNMLRGEYSGPRRTHRNANKQTYATSRWSSWLDSRISPR